MATSHVFIILCTILVDSRAMQTKNRMVPDVNAAKQAQLRDEERDPVVATLEVNDGPSVLDIVAGFPFGEARTFTDSERRQHLQDLTKENSSDLSVAVCSTGHLRTFGLPGMYSSLLANLLATANAHLYLVGHYGKFVGNNPDPNKSQVEIYGETDASLQTALKFLSKYTDRVFLGAGDCKELEMSWQRDKISDRHCDAGLGNFMQIMWVDHCIREVRRSGHSYDVVVRTRPDVGIFSPMPWTSIDVTRVCFMAKDHDSRADFFFTVPWAMLEEWWEQAVEWYSLGMNTNPDYQIFGDENELRLVQFPAVIVRGPTLAECRRLVDPAALSFQRDCDEKAASGYFNQLVVPPEST